MSTASRQQRSKSREAPSVERKASARVKKIYTNRSGPIATRPTNLKTSLSQYQTKSQESLQNKPKKMELTKVGKLVKIQPKKDQIQNTISDFLSPAITDTRNQDLNMTPEVESFIMTSEDGSLKRSKSIKRQSGKSTKGQSTLKSQSQSDLKQSPNGRRSRYSHSLEEKAKFNRGYKQLCQVTDLKQQQSKDSIESGNYTEMQTEIKASNNGAQTPFSQFIDTERQNLTDIQLNSRSQNITFQEEPFRDQTQSYNQENQQIKAISEEDDEAILSKVRSNRSGRSVQALRNNICFNSGRSQQNLKNSSSAYQYLRLNSATSQSNLQVVCVIKKTDVHKGNKCAASAKDSVPSFAQAQNHNQLNKKQDMLVSSSTPGAYCFRARPKIAPLMKVLLKDPSDFITCQQVFSKSDSQTIESTTNLAKLEKPDYKLYKFDSVICEPQGHNIQTSLYKDYWQPIFNVPTMKNTKAQLVLLFGTTDSKKQQLLQLSGVQSNSKEFDNSLVGAAVNLKEFKHFKVSVIQANEEIQIFRKFYATRSQMKREFASDLKDKVFRAQELLYKKLAKRTSLKLDQIQLTSHLLIEMGDLLIVDLADIDVLRYTAFSQRISSDFSGMTNTVLQQSEFYENQQESIGQYQQSRLHQVLREKISKATKIVLVCCVTEQSLSSAEAVDYCHKIRMFFHGNESRNNADDLLEPLRESLTDAQTEILDKKRNCFTELYEQTKKAQSLRKNVEISLYEKQGNKETVEDCRKKCNVMREEISNLFMKWKLENLEPINEMLPCMNAYMQNHLKKIDFQVMNNAKSTGLGSEINKSPKKEKPVEKISLTFFDFKTQMKSSTITNPTDQGAPIVKKQQSPGQRRSLSSQKEPRGGQHSSIDTTHFELNPKRRIKDKELDAKYNDLLAVNRQLKLQVTNLTQTKDKYDILVVKKDETDKLNGEILEQIQSLKETVTMFKQRELKHRKLIKKSEAQEQEIAELKAEVKIHKEQFNEFEKGKLAREVERLQMQVHELTVTKNLQNNECEALRSQMERNMRRQFMENEKSLGRQR